jgi:rhomboid protease GluP
MCPHCRAFIDPKARVCPYCDNEVGKPSWSRPESSSGGLRGLIPQTHFTTVIILALNFGLFVACLILTMKVLGQGGGMLSIPTGVLNAFGAKSMDILVRGQWWRLVTAGFLHGGVFHILMNSWVLLDLGSHAEQVYGTARFLVIYLLSSVFGFVASLYWSPVTSIGASAAACGLIGAMMAYGYRTGSSMTSFYVRWILLIAVIGLLPGFNIDNAAHFGGFGGGFVVGYLAGTSSRNRAVETAWNVAAGVSVAVVAVCMLFAYQWLSRFL